MGILGSVILYVREDSEDGLVANKRLFFPSTPGLLCWASRQVEVSEWRPAEHYTWDTLQKQTNKKVVHCEFLKVSQRI